MIGFPNKDLLKTPNVIIVDNNPAHRNLTRYYLESSRSCKVCSMVSYDECIYRLGKNPDFDFIVSELIPDETQALAFLENVREISSSVRVIFFARFNDPSAALRLHDAGATDYLVKSSGPDMGVAELIKNIRYLTREKALDRDPAPLT